MKTKKNNMANAIAAKVVKMLQGGKMPMYQMGGGVTGGTRTYDQRRDYYETVPTIDASSYRQNEGMIQAISPDRIDAYNFELPSSGKLSDYSPEQQAALRATDFGRQYLSDPNENIDVQYDRWARNVNQFMDRNPQAALRAINDAIDSGNPNFEILKGLSDKEKVETAQRLMTDRKIGDFHGALQFGEKVVPRPTYYDPNPAVRQAGLSRSEPLPMYLVGMGGESVPEGSVSKLVEYAKGRGIDLTQDTEESRAILGEFMNQYGRQAAPEDARASDNQYFMDMVSKEAQQQLGARATQADERMRAAMERINAMKARGYEKGGMVPKKRAFAAEVSPAMQAAAYRTEERSSPFKVVKRGFDQQGNKTYDVSYSPLMNLLRRQKGARAEF
jgi:hypothetical protein